MKPSVYIESSVISYLTAKESKNSIQVDRQKLTKYWWKHNLPYLDPFVSPLVIKEISQGDLEASKIRLEKVKHFPVLDPLPIIFQIGDALFNELKLPEKAKSDSYHIVFAVIHKIDFLVSWNFKHIVNAWVMKQVNIFLQNRNLPKVLICTPEELMEAPK